jgi:phosphoribosylglycinamide formyltransferase
MNVVGAFDGADAIKRAHSDFEAGKLKSNKTGIMIHHVIDEVDRGQPILTREIEIQNGEGLEPLTERIHVQERELLVEATEKMVAEIIRKKQHMRATTA